MSILLKHRTLITTVLVPLIIGISISSKVIVTVIPSEYILKYILQTERQSQANAAANAADLNVDSSDAYSTKDDDVVIMNEEEEEEDFGNDIFAGLNVALHRNGEPEPCLGESISGSEVTNAMETVLNSYSTEGSIDKYLFDSILTESFALHTLLNPTSSKNIPQQTCGPEKAPPEIRGVKQRKRWGRGTNYVIHERAPTAFLSFCDMSKKHTVIQPDHGEMVPVQFGEDGGEIDEGDLESLPCHFHTREGVRITSIGQLKKLVKDFKKQSREMSSQNKESCKKEGEGDNQVCNANMTTSSSSFSSTTTTTTTTDFHIYAVPAGRVFFFAPSYIGEIFDLPHVKSRTGLPVSLKVLSIRPHVFDVLNFFDEMESNDIVERALKETRDSHRIKRSSTGASGYNVNSRRTSENGFDTNGETSIRVKKRCFDVLGFDTYTEDFADGLQVLRYNKTTAYTPHMDWIDDPSRSSEHNFFSSEVGTNRFATILLYMSDLEEQDGGETVFTKSWPSDLPVEERKDTAVALQELRESGDATFLEKGSWQETMVANCRSRLAIRPHSARAVLFYSQYPNGEEDHSSEHGGCPVLGGQKWAANLWVWNGIRDGYPNNPKNERVKKKKRNQGQQQEQQTQPDGISAVFRNTGTNPKFAKAELYYELEQKWGDFSHGSEPLSVNTYEGHVWNVKNPDTGEVLQRWVVAGNKKRQVFEV